MVTLLFSDVEGYTELLERFALRRRNRGRRMTVLHSLFFVLGVVLVFAVIYGLARVIFALPDRRRSRLVAETSGGQIPEQPGQSPHDIPAPTADFTYGQTYRLCWDRASEEYVVVDSGNRLVAALPARFDGEVRTRIGLWHIATEHYKQGWAVIARTIPQSAEAGGAAYRLWPYSYKLWAGDIRYRLTQNALSHRWRIRTGGITLARFGPIDLSTTRGGRLILRESHEPGRTPENPQLTTIEVLEQPLTNPPIDLPILVALHFVWLVATMPTVGSG